MVPLGVCLVSEGDNHGRPPHEKKETTKKDEVYQPLWDTDQSVPEYMTLLMGEQTQKNEDAELYEESDDEELEHPDPDYEYVYPGAPKR